MARQDSYPLHGGQLKAIAERFAIPVAELLDFSANINPAGPPPSVLSTLRASLDDASALTEYPDLRQTELKQSIARYAGVAAQSIVVANGFVPLLEAALRTLNVRRCMLPVPAFVEYRKVLERAAIEISTCPLNNTDFRYDLASLLDGDHDAIMLANPQNPSGVVHDAAFMHDLIAQAAQRNIRVLIDEAFIDYIPEHTLTTAADQSANLIVFRSVTKFHGIPGLRVAYVVTNPSLASAIGESLPPWPITTLAARAVAAALDDQPYAAQSIAENQTGRTALQHGLESLGLTVYPSAANFVLVRLPSMIDPDIFWQRMIVDHRIVLRACANYEGLARGHLRIAVRKPEDNARLLEAFAQTVLSDGPTAREAVTSHPSGQKARPPGTPAS